MLKWTFFKDFDQSNLDVSEIGSSNSQYETSEVNLNHVAKHRNEGSNPDYMNFNLLDTFDLPSDINNNHLSKINIRDKNVKNYPDATKNETTVKI